MDQELNAEIAGQKLNLRNVPIGALSSVATLLLLVGLGVGLWHHVEDTRSASQAFVNALKEQTVAIRDQTAAQREQTCMMRFTDKDKPANADWCRQISR